MTINERYNCGCISLNIIFWSRFFWILNKNTSLEWVPVEKQELRNTKFAYVNVYSA